MPLRTFVLVTILAVQLSAAPANQTWVAVAPSPYGQNGTQTLLNDGRVLEVAGTSDSSSLASLYNPVTNTWEQAAPLLLARSGDLQVTLRDGTVLVAGGVPVLQPPYTPTSEAERYDPVANVWTVAANLPLALSVPATTLMADGRVFVTGGEASTDADSGFFIAASEIYDPKTNAWTTLPAMPDQIYYPSVILLPDGRILVAGQTSTEPASAIYDPVANSWTTAPMVAYRVYPGLAILQTGIVIAAGGDANLNPYISTSEFFDPATNTWSSGPAMTYLFSGTAISLNDGTVLDCGADNGFGYCDLYNPILSEWLPTGSNNQSFDDSLILLPTGNVFASDAQATELYTPGPAATFVFNPTIPVFPDTSIGSATMLPVNLTNAGTEPLTISSVSLVNGGKTTVFAETNSCEGAVLAAGQSCPVTFTFTPVIVGSATATLTVVNTSPEPNVSLSLQAFGYSTSPTKWYPGPTLLTGRSSFGAVGLPGGKILVSGGLDSNNSQLASAELYAPGENAWAYTGSMAESRGSLTMTLLKNGSVLAAGGTPDGSAEIYNATSGAWSATGVMNIARAFSTATLLSNGKLLVSGGRAYATGNITASAEIFDPATGIWTNTGPMTVGRLGQTSTLLPDGRVLITGGEVEGNDQEPAVDTGEIYNPATGTFHSLSARMSATRAYHTATLLTNGMVLIAGGEGDAPFSGVSCDLFNPATAEFSPTASMKHSRYDHTATRLASGNVLVAGGDYKESIASTEIYNPSTGKWQDFNRLIEARYSHAAIENSALSGVMVIGGNGVGFNFGLAATELTNPQ